MDHIDVLVIGSSFQKTGDLLKNAETLNKFVDNHHGSKKLKIDICNPLLNNKIDDDIPERWIKGEKYFETFGEKSVTNKKYDIVYYCGCNNVYWIFRGYIGNSIGITIDIIKKSLKEDGKIIFYENPIMIPERLENNFVSFDSLVDATIRRESKSRMYTVENLDMLEKIIAEEIADDILPPKTIFEKYLSTFQDETATDENLLKWVTDKKLNIVQFDVKIYSIFAMRTTFYAKEEFEENFTLQNGSYYIVKK